MNMSEQAKKEVFGFFIEDAKGVRNFGIVQGENRDECLDKIEPHVLPASEDEPAETVELIPLEEMLSDEYNDIAFCTTERI